MEFVAIDVETANADMASICQIGLAKYSDGQLIDEWVSLVDPEDFFDFINISIHDIDETTVEGAPTLPEIAPILERHLSNSICVSHTSFDRISIHRALEKYQLADISAVWLDSARVARRTWEECAWSGYGLASVCDLLDYQFRHHDALEDAKATGHILLAAIEKSGLDIPDWIRRVERPIDPKNVSTGAVIRRDGDPEGELYGEVMVFTGALEIPRVEAAELAARIGCTVGTGVINKTTLLVVGDQDVTKLAGRSKSSKHRKAEELIAKGQAIRILRESDFKRLVGGAS